MVGRRIGRFHILEPLGRGGMGTVWKARDELLGRVVAVKVLDETLASDAAARRGFRREAEIAALLEHPSIVPVYEAGEDGDAIFLVMKLIDGETLERFNARRLPAPSDVLRIARSITDALGYAHSRGVIHRDITPRNIMRTLGGSVYVLDFGLARVAGATASSTGHVVGTPAYLAPERLGGRPADARSDIYGLGVVLYEALTGTRPFHGERPEVLYYRILSATVEPPRRLRPELTPDFSALILRMMARDPGERPANAEELGAELSRIGDAVGTASPTNGDDPTPDPGPDTAHPVASGRAQSYLAVLPIGISGGDDRGPECRTLVRDLADAARAGLAHIDRLHVVAPESDRRPDEDDRTFARRIGANLLLRATARFDGTMVRVVFSLLDSERGAHIGGGSVDGTVLQPFDLEDRLLAAVREALAVPPDRSDTRWHTRPRDPVARERFAQALSYLSRFDNEASIDGAITLLETLLASEGESAAVHAALARACLHKYQQTRQRTWETRATQACERAVKLDRESPDVLLAVGELHTAAGRYAEALVELDRALALRPGVHELHLARARALDGAGRANDAEAACRQAIALHPEDWRGYHVLGLVLFRHGRYPEAVGPWGRVTQLTPDNASGHRNLGSALFHLDRYEDALAAFRRANEIRPHAMAFYNVGTVLFYLERYEESIEAFEKAVALAPADPWTWGNLGDACRRTPGREARMREALERAVHLMRERLDREPGAGEDLARLAGWLENLGRRDEAERELRRALERAPDDVHCMVAAGITLLNLGARGEALHWIRRAVESGYGTDVLRRSPYLRTLAEDAEFRRILEDGSHGQGAAFTKEPEKGRPS